MSLFLFQAKLRQIPKSPLLLQERWQQHQAGNREQTEQIQSQFIDSHRRVAHAWIVREN
ncbi:MAG: hypothetical protein L7W43_20540 [Rubripirellula sp.]|nr:hypothetical protein [Rubripirellula sp.]